MWIEIFNYIVFPIWAEDAVNEVKKQAAVELQRAIMAAEQKASELVKREHENLEKILHESKKHTVDECVYTDDYQEDSLEVRKVNI